jgi:hypothetical protein
VSAIARRIHLTEIQKAALGAIFAAIFGAAIIFFESRYISDSDLRYPVVLLTKVSGAILVVILGIRVPLIATRNSILKVAPNAHEGIRNFGRVLLVTVFSSVGFVFGATLWIEKTSTTTDYLPIGMLLFFGTLATLGLRYLLREWRRYQRLRPRRI